jgi:hypothetical protein
MKKASEEFKYFLIILFSLWFLIFPAYLYFSILDDSDITPSYPLFEKNDQEDSIPISGEKGDILELTFFIKHVLIDHLSLVWVTNLSYHLTPLNSRSMILLC